MIEPTTSPRGFTLLIAVIMCSVLVSVGLALLDITYKQVLLAQAATQSQYAFYNADTALECALYWDQKVGVFVWDFPGSQGNTALDVKCQGLDVPNYTVTQSGGIRTTSFSVPCAPPLSGTLGTVIVNKTATNATTIYANGYNTCNANDPKRIERGLKAQYGS